eukprot:3882484-Amphidinium_carterae.1
MWVSGWRGTICKQQRKNKLTHIPRSKPIPQLCMFISDQSSFSVQRQQPEKIPDPVAPATRQ